MLALFGNLNLMEIGIVLLVAIMIFGRDLPKVAARIAVHLGRLRRQVETMWREAGIDREIREVQAEIRDTRRTLDPRALARRATAGIERDLDEAGRKSASAPSSPAPSAAGTPPSIETPDGETYGDEAYEDEPFGDETYGDETPGGETPGGETPGDQAGRESSPGARSSGDAPAARPAWRVEDLPGFEQGIDAPPGSVPRTPPSAGEPAAPSEAPRTPSSAGEPGPRGDAAAGSESPADPPADRREPRTGTES